MIHIKLTYNNIEMSLSLPLPPPPLFPVRKYFEYQPFEYQPFEHLQRNISQHISELSLFIKINQEEHNHVLGLGRKQEHRRLHHDLHHVTHRKMKHMHTQLKQPDKRRQ